MSAVRVRRAKTAAGAVAILGLFALPTTVTTQSLAAARPRDPAEHARRVAQRAANNLLAAPEVPAVTLPTEVKVGNGVSAGAAPGSESAGERSPGPDGARTTRETRRGRSGWRSPG
jgi:hypothetical protein